nr:hypothetical protein [Tanacetum cinerariifolium]
MLELLEDYRQKELYCMHNNVDDLIESVLNSKLPSINLKSQRLDKEKQEVKNIVEKPPKQPDNSLSMRDEHLDTIPETESDEVIKSSVENLVPISSEFEVTSDNESECDVPVCDDFTTFSNPLFDCINDFNSSDDKYFIDSSPKSDYLLEEFSGELAHIDPVSPGIKEADFDLEEGIQLNAEITDMILDSLSPFHIPVEDSDSQIEEIDLFLATDDLMSPGIENDDYDSEGDVHILKELLSDDPFSLPENESFNFDHHDDLSFPHPPPEPPDVEVFFDFEPDTGVLTTKVV